MLKKGPMLQFESFIIIFATTVQVFNGGKLFKMRKLFKGGNYSGEETIN